MTIAVWEKYSMGFVKKYLVKHSFFHGKSLHGTTAKSGAGYILLGIIIFYLMWVSIAYLALKRPGYEQFSGFMPLPALKSFYLLLYDNVFWTSVFASMRRIIISILLSFMIGFPFGILTGYFYRFRLSTYLPVQFVRMISPLSWMPIALLLFRDFESAIYFIISMAAVWPIIMNTALGAARVNMEWIKMARNQGASNLQLIFHVIIPSSAPYVLTSLRLALGVSWIVLVPAEFLGISSGLGYIINDARDTMEYDRLMAVIIAIGMIGFILDGSIQCIQKTLKWSWSN